MANDSSQRPTRSTVICPLILIGGSLLSSACLPLVAQSFACREEGYKQTESLVHVLSWPNQAYPPQVSNDCGDSGGAGVEISLNGTVTDAVANIPSALDCTPRKSAVLEGYYASQFYCHHRSTSFVLGFAPQSPARIAKDGFSVDGIAIVVEAP